MLEEIHVQEWPLEQGGAVDRLRGAQAHNHAVAHCLAGAGPRMQLARAAGKPLLLEEFGAQRAYFVPRSTLLERCRPLVNKIDSRALQSQSAENSDILEVLCTLK